MFWIAPKQNCLNCVYRNLVSYKLSVSDLQKITKCYGFNYIFWMHCQCGWLSFLVVFAIQECLFLTIQKSSRVVCLKSMFRNFALRLGLRSRILWGVPIFTVLHGFKRDQRTIFIGLMDIQGLLVEIFYFRHLILSGSSDGAIGVLCIPLWGLCGTCFLFLAFKIFF